MRVLNQQQAMVQHGAQQRSLILPFHFYLTHLLAGFVPHVWSRREHRFWEETSLWLNGLNTGVGIQSQSGFTLG